MTLSAPHPPTPPGLHFPSGPPLLLGGPCGFPSQWRVPCKCPSLFELILACPKSTQSKKSAGEVITADPDGSSPGRPYGSTLLWSGRDQAQITQRVGCGIGECIQEPGHSVQGAGSPGWRHWWAGFVPSSRRPGRCSQPCLVEAQASCSSEDHS